MFTNTGGPPVNRAVKMERHNIFGETSKERQGSV